jgi:hypothetical protein
LLFVKEEIASRAPRTGARLVEKKKRKAIALGRPAKRRKGASGLAAITTESHLIEKGENNKKQSDLVLMYNTIRGYVLVIKELWAHQTSCGLYNTP